MPGRCRTPRWRRTILIGAAFVVAASTAAIGQERKYVQRGLFFSQSPYGALAWIDNVASFDAARSRQFVYDLSISKCHTLPYRRQYWFLINNHGSSSPRPFSYFAVRAIARSVPNQKPSNALILYRNANWVSPSGALLSELNETSKLSIDTFVNFHDDASATTAEQRLKELNDGLRVAFHALPAPDEESSWKLRQIFGAHPQAYDSERPPLFYWASLTRFPAKDAPPQVFYLNNWGISTIWISISGPDVQFPMDEVELRINRECDQGGADRAKAPNGNGKPPKRSLVSVSGVEARSTKTR